MANRSINCGTNIELLVYSIGNDECKLINQGEDVGFVSQLDRDTEILKIVIG